MVKLGVYEVCMMLSISLYTIDQQFAILVVDKTYEERFNLLTENISKEIDIPTLEAKISRKVVNRSKCHYKNTGWNVLFISHAKGS